MKKYKNPLVVFKVACFNIMVFSIILCSAQGKMPVNSDEQRNAIEKITPMAEIIVEGKVINSQGALNKDSNIYTFLTVRISKIFKGKINDSVIQVVYKGGYYPGIRVPYQSSSITIINGTEGIFFIKKDTFNLKERQGVFAYSLVYSRESFLQYHHNDGNPPATLFNIAYYDIEKDVYQRIEATTGQKRKVLRLNLNELQKK